MIKIYATFKGVDGSNGYAKGVTYLLEFRLKGNGVTITTGAFRNSVCDYSSLRRFLDNWEVDNI